MKNLNRFYRPLPAGIDQLVSSDEVLLDPRLIDRLSGFFRDRSYS